MDELLKETCDAERHHFWYAGLRRFARPFLTSAVAGTRRPRLLDAGCGTGGNLALLREFGQSFGFDVTWTGLRFATRLGCSRITCADVGQTPFQDASFDAVTSFDVLYCLDDLHERQAVAEMYRILRPGGSAVINVAAMNMLRGNHSIFDGELRRYSCEGLRALLEQAGFRIIRITHTNFSIFLPMLAIRGLQRVRGLAPPGKARSDFTVPPRVINRFLAALLALEARLLRWVDLPLGSSILCLARKPDSA